MQSMMSYFFGRNRLALWACVCMCFVILGCAQETTPSGSTASAPAASAPAASAPATAPSTTPAAVELPTVRMVRAFAGLTFERPIFLTHPPGMTDRLFIVDQLGRIYVFDNRPDATEKKDGSGSVPLLCQQ